MQKKILSNKHRMKKQIILYRTHRMSFTVVDFPDPFGPSKPNTSPLRTTKSTLSTARAFGRPQKSLKTFVRPRTVTTGSPFRAADCARGSEAEISAGMSG